MNMKTNKNKHKIFKPGYFKFILFFLNYHNGAERIINLLCIIHDSNKEVQSASHDERKYNENISVAE